MNQQQTIDQMRDALRDIVLGAKMMQEPAMSPYIKLYAAEVQRVAEAALRAPQVIP